MARTRWFDYKIVFGHTHDAIIENTMLGGWRVRTEHKENGSNNLKYFRGVSAQRKAIEWAEMVLIPASIAASLAEKS